MYTPVQETQLSDLISEIESIDGVCYDPEGISLHGLYSDELSAYRARRGWTEILEELFFLESKDDFVVRVTGNRDGARFVLSCEFTSASARYAFWRLTHNQAPEAQYLIETAHIPSSASAEELSSPPDMAPLVEEPPIELRTEENSDMRSILNRLLSSLRRVTP